MAQKSPHWGFLLLASSLLTNPAQAAPETPEPPDPSEVRPETPSEVSKADCFTRHEEAQVVRQQRRLLEARALLRACSGATCPAAIRADCVEWLDQLGRSLPTVVVTARAKGIDLANVRVFIDGKLITERLSGATLEVDPGQHEFRFEAPPWPTVERKVLVSEGVKDRSIDVVFAPPDEPPALAGQSTAVAPPTTFRLQKSDYITGGIALAGFATTALFGSAAIAEKRQLEDGCKPTCTESEVARVSNKTLTADIALGVAVVSLVVGLYLHLTGRGTF